MKFNKILIAVDDSALSLKTAKMGFELAHQLKAEIAMVFVVDISMEIGNADLGINDKQKHVVLLQEAETTIQQYIDLYDGIDKIYRFTPEGEPHKEIINIANDWGADLIVMGTHGRRGFSRLVMGSVADYVTKHSKIPVFIAPPEMGS